MQCRTAHGSQFSVFVAAGSKPTGCGELCHQDCRGATQGSPNQTRPPRRRRQTRVFPSAQGFGRSFGIDRKREGANSSGETTICAKCGSLTPRVVTRNPICCGGIGSGPDQVIHRAGEPGILYREYVTQPIRERVDPSTSGILPRRHFPTSHRSIDSAVATVCCPIHRGNRYRYRHDRGTTVSAQGSWIIT